MTNEPFLTLACAGLIGLLFGTALTFAGYRLFLVLLPIWGFFFGFGLGAQTVQVLFGDAFLATVTSWVVGFIVALIFGALAYLFYLFAVAIIGGSLGYAVVVGILQGLGLNLSFLVWLIGIVAFVVMAFVTIRFNLQKWVVEIATSVLGAATIIGVFILLFSPHALVLANPVQLVLQTSPLLMLLFIVLAVAGIIVQVRANRRFEVQEYDRWEATTQAPTV